MKKRSLAMVAGVATLLFASAATAGSVRADGSARSATTLKVCPDADKCFTSIQAAIDAAKDGAKIKIAAGTYQGSLVIDKDITLDGAGAGETMITADAKARVITVAAGLSVTIKALTVTGGSLQFIPAVDPPAELYPDFVGGGIFLASSSSLELFDVTVSANLASSGGGIYNDKGTLTLERSTVTGNRLNEFTSGFGGGIYSEGTLTLRDSTVSDNRAFSGVNAVAAGGIFTVGATLLSDSIVRRNLAGSTGGIRSSGTMTLKRVTVSGNAAEFGSGGIDCGGTVIVEDSVVSDNHGALSVGGIGNGGALTVTDSTISENHGSFGHGGGIENFGTMMLKNTTITDNTGNEVGGGILNRGMATLEQTTVSGNSAGVGGGIANGNPGGGIDGGNALTLRETTVSGNTAVFGGGIYNAGPLTLSETTVSGNTATCTGGGLYNVATVLLFASTISGNTPNDRVDAAPGVPAPCV